MQEVCKNLSIVQIQSFSLSLSLSFSLCVCVCVCAVRRAKDPLQTGEPHDLHSFLRGYLTEKKTQTHAHHVARFLSLSRPLTPNMSVNWVHRCLKHAKPQLCLHRSTVVLVRPFCPTDQGLGGSSAFRGNVGPKEGKEVRRLTCSVRRSCRTCCQGNMGRTDPLVSASTCADSDGRSYPQDGQT